MALMPKQTFSPQTSIPFVQRVRDYGAVDALRTASSVWLAWQASEQTDEDFERLMGLIQKNTNQKFYGQPAKKSAGQSDYKRFRDAAKRDRDARWQ